VALRRRTALILPVLYAVAIAGLYVAWRSGVELPPSKWTHLERNVAEAAGSGTIFVTPVP
jgi:hypothetical protein